jgi:hypothetical protein
MFSRSARGDTTILILNLRLKQLHQNIGAYLNAQINTENLHKYLQQPNQTNSQIIRAFTKCRRNPKILASHENIGGFSKYWRIFKILASHENIGGFPKYWRLTKMLADTHIIGGFTKC